MRPHKSFCASVIFFLALASASHAQGIAPGSAEVSGNLGYAHVDGVTSKNHFAFGGSGSYNLNHVAAVGFEYRYTPLGSETISGVKASAHLQTYGGVVRFSFRDASVAPFALVGFGGANEKAVASFQGVTASAGQSGYYFAFGGGATIFTGPHWGIRPEFRYERQQFVANSQFNSFGQNNVQGLVSVFYQFGDTPRRKH